ncbi:MAG: hypothetical protein ACJAYB_000918 [Psychromonas sp.]|jgi:hypothetical protein
MYRSTSLNHAVALFFIGYAAFHASYHTYLNSLTEP